MLRMCYTRSFSLKFRQQKYAAIVDRTNLDIQRGRNCCTNVCYAVHRPDAGSEEIPVCWLWLFRWDRNSRFKIRSRPTHHKIMNLIISPSPEHFLLFRAESGLVLNIYFNPSWFDDEFWCGCCYTSTNSTTARRGAELVVEMLRAAL